GGDRVIGEEKLVPKRRFEEFKLDWKQKRFGDYFNIASGYAFKKSDYSFKGIPIINGESIQNGKIKTDNLNYLPEKFFEGYNNFLVKTDDIVIGLNRPIINNKLKISLIPKHLNDSMLYQRAGKIIKINKMHTYFAYQMLEKEILKYVKEESVGSDQPFISTTELMDFYLQLPENNREQQKIGAFFKVLDERIANQERKIAKVKALKAAYLTEMFPQEGETVPKRRFKGFEREWDIYLLKDLIEYEFKGKTNTNISGSKKTYLENEYLNGGKKSSVNVEADTEEEDVIILWDGSNAGTVYHGFKGALGSTLKSYKPKY